MQTQAFSRKVDYAMSFRDGPTFLCFSCAGLDFVDPYVYRSRTFQEQFREFGGASLRMLWWSEHPCRMRHQWKEAGRSQTLTEGYRPREDPIGPPSISCEQSEGSPKPFSSRK